ncbi:MAG: glycoside hydrolase family 6 protein [Candidatus Taylorbacteria bacterium]|nr:glycoside hydrolase family 6 protein [Candidatus Taylorbacteria bacterium]
MIILRRPHGLSDMSLLALLILFGAFFAGIPANVRAAEAVEVWWPAQNASVQGTQPFKAIVSGKALSDYQMSWSVDGGSPVKMYDSNVDYPHKEALVDVSNWKWNSNGTYSVSFIARDGSGAEIARSVVSIKNSGQAAAPAPATSPQAVTLTNPTAPALTAPTTGATKTVTARLAKVTSPLVGARVSGAQALKAVVIGLPLEGYKMYWSVDGGAQNEMYDSSVGGLHKESMIDFSKWTWKGSSPYPITVVAKNADGAEIARTSTLVYVVATPAAQTSATTADTAPVAQVISPEANVQPKLYVDPNNPAIAQASAWRQSRPSDAAIMDKVGANSSGIWLGGWNADVESDVRKAVTAASTQDAAAVFVAYNIPGRDCGQYSAGGLSGKEAYLSWIGKIKAGIGSGKAIVILEPDALTLNDCLSETGKAERYGTLSSAIDSLSANPGTKVYIDAGHPQWLSSTEAASRLEKAGVSKAAGFALNTSNFIATAQNIAYGTEVSKAVDGKRFVIDTSRNGNGQGETWCNPSGRALGEKPGLSTGNPLVDAYLWVKKPGESDGSCNGGPSAGSWWPEYALDLAKRASY